MARRLRQGIILINLETVQNVRDLGGIPVADGRAVKSGLFLRGAHLARLSDADEQELFQTRGVTCVLDLRCGWELEAKPETCPDFVQYVHNPFYDADIVGVEYHRPVPGTISIGHDFACDPDDFYRDMTNPRTLAQAAKAVRLLVERGIAGETTYFHCSGGKDRAGITTLCLLTVLGASKEDILADYLITNESRKAHEEGIYRRFLRLAQGDEVLARQLTDGHAALPQNLTAYYEEIAKTYPTLDDFVRDGLSISDELRAQAIAACTEAANG